MQHFRDRYTRLLQRRSFWIICAFFAVLPMIVAGSVRAVNSNTNDVQDWLPASYQETVDLQWYVSKFSSGSDQVVIVSWSGCRLDDPRLPMLAAKLRSDTTEPKLFNSVVTGPELIEQLTTEPLDLHRTTALQRLEGSLIGPPYLHGLQLDSDEQGRPRVARIDPESPAARSGLQVGLIVEQINDEPTDTLEAAHQVLIATYKQVRGVISIQTLNDPQPASWQFSDPPPARQTGMMVTLSPYGSFEKRLASTLARIQEVAVDECAIPASTLRMGGPPVDNVAIDLEGQRTLARLAGLSYGVGLLLCWLIFRDWRLTCYVFFTAMFSQATSLAIVHYTGGKVDAILLSMPTLVYMLTIAAAVHIVNYWRDSLGEGDAATAAAHAVSKGFVPCTLASFTTAVGLASLYISDLVPIRNFGIYSAAAVLAALAWIFLFLPAWLSYWPPASAMSGAAVAVPSPSAVKRRAFFTAVGNLIVTRNGIVVTACLAMVVFFGYTALYKMQTTVKLMKLFNGDAKIIHDYRWLESTLGALVPMEVIVHTSQAERLVFDGTPTGGQFQLQWERPDGEVTTGPLPYNAKADDVAYALDAAGLSDANVRRSVTDKGREFHITLDNNLPPPVMTVVDDLEGATIQVGHPLGVFDSIRLVDQVRQKVESLPDVDTTLSAVTFAPSLVKPRRTPRFVWRASIDSVLDRHMEEYYRSGFVAHDYDQGELLYRVSLRLGAFSDVDYSHFVQEIREAVDPIIAEANGAGVDVTYTGVVPLVYKAQNELLKGLFESYGLAFALIALVMVALLWRVVGTLKCVPAGLLLMVPNLFPTALVFGFLSWSGVLIDVGTMMAASVGLGVAVDDTVHFITWFRRGLASGLDRKAATNLAYEHCAVAMAQTTVIAGLGMLMFAASTFTPTQRFGLLMVPLFVMALIGDLVMLPAILTSRLGKIFEPKQAKASQPPAEPVQIVEAPELDLEPVEDPLDPQEIAVPLMRPPVNRPTEGKHSYRVVGM